MRVYKCYKTVGATKYLTTLQEVQEKLYELENNGHQPLNYVKEEKRYTISYNHRNDIK